MTPCEATTYMRDDRWGGFVEHCELNDGHPGPHRAPRSACEPVAWLEWVGTYERKQPRS